MTNALVWAAISVALFITAMTVLVLALCRAAAKPAPHPVPRREPVETLLSVGEDADAVLFDFTGGWRNGQPR